MIPFVSWCFFKENDRVHLKEQFHIYFSILFPYLFLGPKNCGIMRKATLCIINKAK